MNPVPTFELVRNAIVEASSHRDYRNHPIAKIVVNGKYTHQFTASSRISRSLETMSEQDLQDRMQGGTFLFVNNNLVDYRDGFYNGFIQDDASIAALARVIGIQPRVAMSTSLHDNLITHDWVLGAKWGASEISVPEIVGGGEFENELLFGWSPFNKDINYAFVLREVSTGNLLRGRAAFLRKRIPLVNRWEEHLDIACKQLQTRIDSEVKRRLKTMIGERASVQELQLLYDHAKTRLEKGLAVRGSVAGITLQRIMRITSPLIHCNKIYKENVFTDMRIAAQRAGHLSVFDAYKVAIELRTRTVEVDGSSTLAIDRYANDLIFNRTDLTQYGARYETTKTPAFEDLEAAFNGSTN
jgi:hypothetical protein